MLMLSDAIKSIMLSIVASLKTFHNDIGYSTGHFTL